MDKKTAKNIVNALMSELDGRRCEYLDQVHDDTEVWAELYEACVARVQDSSGLRDVDPKDSHWHPDDEEGVATGEGLKKYKVVVEPVMPTVLMTYVVEAESPDDALIKVEAEEADADHTLLVSAEYQGCEEILFEDAKVSLCEGGE